MLSVRRQAPIGNNWIYGSICNAYCFPHLARAMDAPKLTLTNLQVYIYILYVKVQNHFKCDLCYNACIDVQSILRTFFFFFSFLAKKIPKRQN